jgi:hypothetical protein
MKKLIVASMAIVLLLGFAQIIAKSAANKGIISVEKVSVKKNSKKSEAGHVNALTKRKFNQHFGNLSNTVWVKSNTLDKVTFTKDGNKNVAYYNSDSRLVGTSFATIPEQALSDLQTRYKDYSIGSVIFFDKSEANAIAKLVYGTQLKEENFLVELTNDRAKIVVQVNVKGGISVINQI